MIKNIQELLFKKKVIFYILTFLFIWQFIGLLRIDSFEGEGYYEFFIKKSPSYQLIFTDPYRSDILSEYQHNQRVDSNDDWLIDSQEFKDFIIYCHSRYGIELIYNYQILLSCKEADKKRTFKRIFTWPFN